MWVDDPQLYTNLVFHGALGAAESYLQGHWRTDDLVALVRLMVRNRAAASALESGLASWLAPLRWVTHWRRANTLSGSRQNIADHYDLGNDLFELFLDETMTYSSGVFADENASLAEAQRAKFDRICRQLALQPSDHLLEIGCGWGGLALYAAKHYGCRVTGVTLSEEQLAYARALMQREGVAERVELRLEDYRQTTGQFDKLVSVEMIESVGHEFLPEYFHQCSDLLREDGLMLLQAITIADQLYDSYLNSIDFIQRYVFPGGSLPSLTVIQQCLGARTDLRLERLDTFGDDYARTLTHWRQRFNAQEPRLRELGLDDAGLRLWNYYFAYCAGAFWERQINVAQLLLAKPRGRAGAG